MIPCLCGHLQHDHAPDDPCRCLSCGCPEFRHATVMRVSGEDTALALVLEHGFTYSVDAGSGWFRLHVGEPPVETYCQMHDLFNCPLTHDA